MQGEVLRVREGEMAFRLRRPGFSYRVTGFEQERPPKAVIGWANRIGKSIRLIHPTGTHSAERRRPARL